MCMLHDPIADCITL